MHDNVFVDGVEIIMENPDYSELQKGAALYILALKRQGDISYQSKGSVLNAGCDNAKRD